MKKLIVQRKVEIWIEEAYSVEEINQDIIDKALDYELDSYSCEPLWETQVDLNDIDVYDGDYNVLYSTWAEKEMNDE